MGRGSRVGHTMTVFLEVSEQVLGRVFTASKHPASEPDSRSLCDSQGTTSILGPRAGPRPTPCTTSPRGGPGGRVAGGRHRRPSSQRPPTALPPGPPLLSAASPGLVPEPCVPGNQGPLERTSFPPLLPSCLTNPVSLCRQLSCPTAAVPSTAPGEPGGCPHSC